MPSNVNVKWSWEVDSLRTMIPLIICLFVICTGLFYPTAHAAEMTIIYRVNGPSRVVAGSEAPLAVSVTVYYNNAVPGSRLVVGVLDAGLSPQRIVPGVVAASTDPCGNQPGASALCAITVPNSSGSVEITFQVGGIFGGREQPGMWNLNVTSLLIDPRNSLVPGSVSTRLLKIDLIPLTLKVNVPSIVAVSVDGVLQPVGSTSVEVALGEHNITVPPSVVVSNFTRLKFDHWADGYSSGFRTVVVTNSTTLQADYVTQNLLTLVGVQGKAVVSTWYDSNSNATFSTSRYEPAAGVVGELGGRLSFQGWYENGELLTDSPTGTISMDTPHTLTAVWHGDYSVPIVATLVILAAAAVTLLTQRSRRPAASWGGMRRMRYLDPSRP